MSNKQLSPGSKAPVSGQYGIVGPRGEETQEPKELLLKTNQCHQHQNQVKSMFLMIRQKLND